MSKLRENGLLFLQHGRCSDCQIVRLEQGRVQRCHMIQAFLHRVISAELETLLGRIDRYRALACNFSGNSDCLLIALLLSVSDLANEASLESFCCRENPTRVGQLSRPAVIIDNLLESLKNAETG